MSHGKRSLPGRRGWFLIAAAWTLFIWGHSLVNGPSSTAESSAFVEAVRPLFDALSVPNTDIRTFIVRKLAHFSEYAVLGVLLSAGRHAGERDLRPWERALSWAPVLLVPVLDETIQLFVPGRSGMVTDVAIDVSGALVGTLLFHLVHQIFQSK